jgi:uncharacterized protein (TIGR03435 family)
MVLKLTIGSLVVTGAIWAQPSFEVATVKLDTLNQRGWSMPPPKGGKFTAQNVTLAQLIATAWHVQDFQVSGAHGWMNSDRYDIVAKAADPAATNEQMRAMLKNLLVERFHLQAQVESQEEPLYALVIAKHGPKLQKAKGCSGEPGMKNPCGGFAIYQRSQLTGLSVTTEQLAEQFPWLLQRVVVDKTGLDGLYDIKLQWSAEHLGMEENPSQPVSSDQPSLFTALEQQLGLKLEGQRGPVDIVVIDHANRPIDN